MPSPTQHLMPKIPIFNLNAGNISAHCGQYQQKHTFKTGTFRGWSTVQDPFGMVGEPGAWQPSKSWTDSFPFTNVLQESQQKKKNYITQNCKNTEYFCITLNNIFVSMRCTNV